MNKLEKLIAQSVGEASMCWSETPNGIFDSAKANHISNMIMVNIQAYYGKNDSFELDLSHLINRYSLEAGSDTPDFILAQYLNGCLENFNHTVARREDYYGRESKIYRKMPPIDVKG